LEENLKAFIAVFALLAVVFTAMTFYFLTGGYNVAATSPHWAVTVKVLRAVSDRSIQWQSRGIGVPGTFNDPKLSQIGFNHYHAMCRLCHGAPGYEPSEFARGLYPSPPNLTSGRIQQWSDSQLYWIVKNGVKMTGMPAFGVTHDKEEMWGIVAFLRRLPKLTPVEYRRLVKAAMQSGMMNHDHGGDDHDHTSH
jgi:hypothetical protein